MIIAIAADGTRVAGHFGHCERFALYNAGTGRYSYLDSPEHQPGILPAYLKQNGAEVVIAGGMGERARMLFESLGIKVYAGVERDIDEAVQMFLAGQLVSKNQFCTPHEHGDQCGSGHEHGHAHGHGSGHGGCGQG